MLKKLLKRDLTATSRLFVPMLLVYVTASLIAKGLLELFISAGPETSGGGAISLLFILVFMYAAMFILYLVACILMTVIFIIYDFYKTMIKEESYLTHTLPVSSKQLLNSKMIIAFFWQCVTMLVTIVSVFMFMAGHINVGQIKEFFAPVFREIPYSYLVLSAVSLVLSLICGTLTFFVSMAIGHLNGKHPLITSIGVYTGIRIVMDVASAVFTVFFFDNKIKYTISSASYANGHVTANIYASYGNYIWNILSCLCTVALIVCFYWVTQYIFAKKINIE